MDKDKLNGEMNKLMQNKKFVNCLIVLLVIIFLWLAASNFIGDDAGLTKGNNNNTNSPVGAQEVSSDDGITISKKLLDYEEQKKQELKDILSKIDGVGEVEVEIYFESSEVLVPATNSSIQTSETEEQDNNGGNRVTKQETQGTTVVMKNDSNTSEPFIAKTYKPQITGVIIVAEGAKSSKITYEIQKAVASFYDLSLDTVNVYPMK
jgi:stage III sporulation protein AG